MAVDANMSNAQEKGFSCRPSGISDYLITFFFSVILHLSSSDILIGFHTKLSVAVWFISCTNCWIFYSSNCIKNPLACPVSLALTLQGYVMYLHKKTSGICFPIITQ